MTRPRTDLAALLRIPRNLDSDSTAIWTRIPRQTGQSERSDAGLKGFTLSRVLGSSFWPVVEHANVFSAVIWREAQRYPRPPVRLRSLYSRLAGEPRTVYDRGIG